LSERSGSVLFATNKQDIKTDYLVREMRHRGVPFLRLNTEDLPQTIVTFAEGSVLTGTISIRGVAHQLAEFASAYYRRPEPPDPKTLKSGEARAYAVQEWSATIRNVVFRDLRRCKKEGKTQITGEVHGKAGVMLKTVKHQRIALRIRYGILIGTIAFELRAQWLLLHDPIWKRTPATWARF